MQKKKLLNSSLLIRILNKSGLTQQALDQASVTSMAFICILLITRLLVFQGNCYNNLKGNIRKIIL